MIAIEDLARAREACMTLHPPTHPPTHQGTYEACMKLLAGGEDLSGGAGSSSAADRILAEEE
jgi:hypothetical protein